MKLVTGLVGGLFAFIASLGVLAICISIVISICAFILSIYGLVLAFSANVILGIVALFVEPAPLVFGAAAFFFHVNLPQLIMHWVNTQH